MRAGFRRQRRLARDEGFDLVGVAGVAETAEHRFFPQWLAQGYGGEMRYLEARNDAGELKRASLANASSSSSARMRPISVSLKL